MDEDEIEEAIVSILKPAKNLTYYTLQKYYYDRNDRSPGFVGALRKLVADGTIITNTIDGKTRYELAEAAEWRKVHSGRNKNPLSWEKY